MQVKRSVPFWQTLQLVLEQKVLIESDNGQLITGAPVKLNSQQLAY
jgi:hypothetical protein